MKVTGFGCSSTKWYWSSWIDYISALTGIEINNLGCPGDSNDIIFKKLLVHLTQKVNDTVIIYWSEPFRYSFFIDDQNIEAWREKFATHFKFASVLDHQYLHSFSKQKYTNITLQNPIHETDLFSLNSSEGSKFNTLEKIISAQYILKAKGIEYRMILPDKARFMLHDPKFLKLSEEVDQNNIVYYQKRISYNMIDNHMLPIDHWDLAKKLCESLDLEIINNNDTISVLHSELISEYRSKAAEVYKETNDLEKAQTHYRSLLLGSKHFRLLLKFKFFAE